MRTGSAANPRALSLLAAACIASALVLSCQASSSLLSDSERKSLYTIALSSNGGSIVDGSVFDTSAALQVAVTKASEAEEPMSLDLSLENPDAHTRLAAELQAGPAGSAPASVAPVLTQATTLVPATAAVPATAGAAAGSSAIAEAGTGLGANAGKASGLALVPAPLTPSSSRSLVGRLTGALPPIAISSNLKSGSYRIAASLYGQDRTLLQRTSYIVFIGTPSPAIASVSVYPPAAEPGASMLLQVELGISGTSPSSAISDPWIRWSREGRTFAEGLLSKGLDKVVWSAPRIEGAYALLVEAFPSSPPDSEGFPFRSSANQEFKAMVKASVGGEDEFADPLQFLSLLRFEGNFDDSGTRVRSAPPSALGSPRLDVYPGGFGYRFGKTSGISLPGLMPPSTAGSLSGFSALFRLAADSGDGNLLHFDSEDGSFSMVLGLRQSRPFVEIVSGGQASRSVAAEAVTLDPMTLVAALRIEGGQLRIVWYAEGRRIEAPSLNVPPVPARGRAAIGGPDSLQGVYSAFGLRAGGAPPAYRIASRRVWKSRLVLAEGFEDGLMPAGDSSAGGASVRAGSVDLPVASSLRFSALVDIGRHLSLEAEFSGDFRSAFLRFERVPGSAGFSILGSGEVLDSTGKSLGSLRITDGLVAFDLGPSPDRSGIIITQAGTSLALALRPAAGLGLVVGREGGHDQLALERIIVWEGPSSGARAP